MKLSGSIVALVTPMFINGDVDYSSLEELVEKQIESGTDAIVILGSTGEAITLNVKEKIAIIEHVVKKANGRIPIIVGSNQNGTIQTIEQTKKFSELGVDAFLLSCPAYVKPTQEGLKTHFKKIAQSIDLPIFLYNIPGRACCDLEPNSVIELSKIPNIVGIKESSGEVDRVATIVNGTESDFIVLSGDDNLALRMIKSGAKGVVSVAANLVPSLIKELTKNALAKNFNIAAEIEQKITKLNEKLFVESNPIPVKWALYKLGLIDKGIRLPLTFLSPEYQGQVNEVLKIEGILIKS